MSAYKIWRLGEYKQPGKAPNQSGGDMPEQGIDHIWFGKPTTGQTMADCDHISKIKVFGADCVEVASRTVESLNAADQISRAPATSARDNEDRTLVMDVLPRMGSMATAKLYHVLGLNYGDVGFQQALDTASRTQLDALLENCRPYQWGGPRQPQTRAF